MPSDGESESEGTWRVKGEGRKGGAGGEGEGAQRREGKENFIQCSQRTSPTCILTAVTPLHIHINNIVVMHRYASFPGPRLEHIGLIPRL